MRRATGSAWIRIAGVLGFALVACKSAPQGAMPPSGGGGGGGGADHRSQKDSEPNQPTMQRRDYVEIESRTSVRRETSDDFRSIQRELDTAVEQLDAVRAQSHAAASNAQEHAARCDRICVLAEQICSLRDRMCRLSEEHPKKPRYARACAHAGETCEDARQACDGCDR